MLNISDNSYLQLQSYFKTMIFNCGTWQPEEITAIKQETRLL